MDWKTISKNVVLQVVYIGFLLPLWASPQEEKSATTGFSNDPKARAVYDRMVKTMRQAKTLSWVSKYRWESGGNEIGRCTYSICMMKPNYVRLEVMNARSGEKSGVLIGDGSAFWTFWPNGKPRYAFEQSGEYGSAYEKNRMTYYLQKPSPTGHHSIAHETGLLGEGMGMTILEPSTFHGYTDTLQFQIDGIRFIEAEQIDDEPCDGIEIHMMRHQRIRTLWISRKDHLPRKLKEVVRASSDIITHETWSNVTLDAEMEKEIFTWSPPDGWKKWRKPSADEGLLIPGVEAPDFELASADGGKIRLSALRGKVVVLYVWKSG